MKIVKIVVIWKITIIPTSFLFKGVQKYIFNFLHYTNWLKMGNGIYDHMFTIWKRLFVFQFHQAHPLN